MHARLGESRILALYSRAQEADEAFLETKERLKTDSETDSKIAYMFAAKLVRKMEPDIGPKN